MRPIDVIFDTDIGSDSDDVGAMMVLHGLQKQGLCRVLATTSSTSRRDGAAIIDVINKFYGCNIPIGNVKNKDVCAYPVYGGYSRAVSFAYENSYRDKDPDDAVKVMRRALSAAEGEVRLITVGAFVNVAALLKSGGDEISPLSGYELVKRKVSDMYSMAGNFCGDTEFCGNKFKAECNVMIDLPDTRYVAENFPKPITYSPFELGVRIKTGEKLLAGKDNPMKMAYYVHNITPRESWDPLTTYAAIAGEDLFEVKTDVTVTVNGDGVTECTAGGKDRILTGFKDTEKARQTLEDLMCV